MPSKTALAVQGHHLQGRTDPTRTDRPQQQASAVRAAPVRPPQRQARPRLRHRYQPSQADQSAAYPDRRRPHRPAILPWP